LKPQASPVAKVVGLFCIAAFWNGIVSVFVWQAVKSWQRGHPEYFLTIFMIPFVAVGLGLIGGIGYYLLALFNPRVRLTLDSRSVPVGSAVNLHWQLNGRATKLRRLEIVLEGREEATYTRGTTSGAEVTGHVTWEMPAAPKSIELRLFWFTRGKGTTDVHVAETIRFDFPRAADRRDFRFRLPAAPYSFSGKLISLLWALELVVLPGNDTVRAEITLSPTGQEIVLEGPR
jgi:hypothetical protein